MITDKRVLIEIDIASILDHPSVFMGGPSRQNRIKAQKIINYLEKDGVLTIPSTPSPE